MEKFFHSVTLDKELCKGCTNCVKRCPTEAIRVRDKKATIIKERCIDCGECIRICPQHAKKAVVDPLDVLKNYKYTIALPAPSLYGQFKDLDSPDTLVSALRRMGFDDVFEVAVAAEVVSAATRRAVASGKFPKPVISPACPAVLRIIRVRFPELIPHILTVHSPMEYAARWAKRLAVKKTGLAPEDIGCIFISPCPAKATIVKEPLGTSSSAVDAVVSIAEVYPKLLPLLRKPGKSQDVSKAGELGAGWAAAGGECLGVQKPERCPLPGDGQKPAPPETPGVLKSDCMAADGIENVIRVLEAIEDEKITDVDFVELNACVGGCVGGVLTVESPFIARSRINRMLEGFPDSASCPEDMPSDILWDQSIDYEPVMRLDENISVAMEKLARIKELEEQFNGMDCGACGAPSCRALAEDIVSGVATEDQCIFRMRERLQSLLNACGGEEAE